MKITVLTPSAETFTLTKVIGRLISFCILLISSFAATAQTATFTTPGTTTWTVPAGVFSVTVDAWGGGGAGGGINTSNATTKAGGGGAGGSFTRNSTVAVTPGQVINVTVGPGGTAAALADGGQGGTSTFGSNTPVSAIGGAGGKGATNATVYGAGGAVTTGITRNGGSGATAGSTYSGGGGGGAGTTGNGGNASNATAGAAGTGGGGIGAAGRNSAVGDGIAATALAGGGSGARSTNNTDRTGGNGFRGQIVVTWAVPGTFISQFLSMSTGSATWCAGETRAISVTIRNNGTLPWTDMPGQDINIGVKWDGDPDYLVRVDAQNLAAGATNTYNFTVTAPAAGANHLTFDVVYEAVSWFGNNGNGVGPGNTVYTSGNLTVAASPVAPTGSAVQNFCATQNARVSNLTATGTAVKWYNISSGGTALATTDLLASGTYYASQTVGTCESSSRLAVTVNVVNPAAPSATTPQNFCSINNPTVANLLPAIGTNIRWYSVSSGGTPLNAGDALVNGAIYYAASVVTTPITCESVNRTAVTVNITTTPAPTATSPQTFCAINNPTVNNLTATGTALKWYAASTGGAALGTATALTTTTYFVSQTVAGCESTRTPVSVVVNNPAAPGGSSTQTFCSSPVPIVGNLSATGSGIKWYAAASGGSQLAAGTALVNGNHYYASQTVSGCEGTARFDVTVNITPAINVTAQPDPIVTVCATNPVSLSVTASGVLSYQWYKGAAMVTNTANISGANTATLSFNQVTVADAGAYTLTMTGNAPCGPVSVNTTLVVNQDIIITSQPTSVSQCAGTTAVFSVTATGVGLTYQWRKGTTNINNGGRISGANSSTLTITNIDATDNAANYNVVMTAIGGICSQATSAYVSLTAKPRPVATATPSSPFICSGSTTSIALGSNVGVTFYSWTVVQTGVSGASNDNGDFIMQTLTATGNVPGTAVYTITPSADGCDGTPITATVTVNPTPTVTAVTTPSTAVCSGGTINIALGQTVSGTTFSWTVVQTGVSGASANSGNTINQTLTATGANPGTAVYTITPTANGCPGTAQVVTITVNPVPVATAVISPLSGIICSGATTNITFNSSANNTTYTWTAAATGVTGASNGSGSSIAQVLTNTGTASGTIVYTITPTANGLCVGNSFTATITVQPAATITATPASQSICSGTSTNIVLGGLSGSVFSWTVAQTGVTGATAGNGGSIAQTLTTTGTTAGTATYTVTPTANGCPGTPVSVTITVNPQANITPLTQTICHGASITSINTSGAPTGTITSWARVGALPANVTTTIAASGTNGPIAGSFNNTSGATQTITYNVTVQASNGCSRTVQATVIVYSQLIAPVISSSQILCSGADAATIGGTLPTGGNTASYSYQWQNSADGTNFTNINGANSITYNPPTANAYYQLVVTNTCGTVTSNIIQIATAANFAAGFGDPEGPQPQVCTGSSFVFEIESAGIAGGLGSGRYIRFQWQSQVPGAITSATTSPFGTSSSFFIFVFYSGNATFNFVNNTSVPISSNLVITPTIYNSNGTVYCSLSPYVYPVTIHPKPVIPAQSVTACSAAAFSFAPQNGVPTSATIVPANTVYTWLAPTAVAGLTGQSAGTNQTTFNQTLTNSTTAAITIVYTVTPRYNGASSCPGNPFTVNVTVNPKPFLPTQTTTICSGGSFNLTAGGAGSVIPAGTTYSWTAPVVTGGMNAGFAGSGSTISGGVFNNPTATVQTATYTVTPTAGSGAGGCVGNSFQVVVSVQPVPTAAVTASASSICSTTGSSTITFTGSANATVTYNVNGGGNQTITLNGAGTNSVNVTGVTSNQTYTITSITFAGNTCPRTISSSVTVTVLPALTASIGASSSTICAGGSVTLNFTGTPNAVITFGPGTQTVTLNGSGMGSVVRTPAANTTYTLTSVAYATAPFCSTPVTGSATVTINPNATAGIVSGASSACISPAALQYTVSGNSAVGTWSSSNASVASITTGGVVTALSAGTTNIIYTVGTGCFSPVSSSTQLTVNPNATAGTVSGAPLLCVGAQFNFSNNGGDAGGAWSSSNTAVATVSSTGLVTAVGIGASTISYTVTMGCNVPVGGLSSSYAINVQSVAQPAQPSAISGGTLACSGVPVVYSVATVPGATTYSWTVPSGWNITAGSNTNSITVTPGTAAGNITVYAANACGISSPRTMAVTAGTSGQWIGHTADWNDPANWCSGVPTLASNVTIPFLTGGYVYPSASTGTARVNNLTIAAGASVTVNGYTLEVSGTITGNHAINAQNGTIQMRSALPQNISGNYFTGNKVHRLTIFNDAGVTVLAGLSDSLVITDLLDFGSGDADLVTNDNITLRSTAGKTAAVGEIAEGNTIFGKMTVERFLPNFRAWRFVATPVTAAGSPTFIQSWGEEGNNSPGFGTRLTGPVTTGGLEYSPGNSIKWWDGNAGTGGAYQMINNGHSQVARKEGYMLYVRGDRTITPSSTNSTATTLRIKGNVNTGDQPYTVGVNKFVSIGNPYPAAISAQALLDAAGPGVQKAIYAWDPSISGYYFSGGYQTLLEADGFEAPVGGSALYTDGGLYPEIQSGQAFFLYNPGAATTFNITEDMKRTGVATGVQSRTNTIADREFIRAKLFTSANVIADGNLVAFDDEYSNSVDEDDAYKFANGGENFGILRNGKSLAAETRGRIVNSDTIFYNMTNIKVAGYKLVITAKNVRHAGMTAFLVDKFLSTHTTVSLTDTTTINFSGTSAAASRAANRFMLVFKRNMVVLPVTIVSVSATRKQDRSIAVNWKVENEINIMKYEVQRSKDGVNFDGILSTDPVAVNGGRATYQQTDFSPLAKDNFYRIKAISLNGQVQYSAIAKVMAVPVAASIAVYPNPVTDKVMNVAFTGQEKGNYLVELVAVSGQVVHSSRVVVAGNNVTEQIQLDKSLAAGRYQLRVTGAEGRTTLQSVLIK